MHGDWIAPLLAKLYTRHHTGAHSWLTAAQASVAWVVVLSLGSRGLLVTLVVINVGIIGVVVGVVVNIGHGRIKRLLQGWFEAPAAHTPCTNVGVETPANLALAHRR